MKIKKLSIRFKKPLRRVLGGYSPGGVTFYDSLIRKKELGNNTLHLITPVRLKMNDSFVTITFKETRTVLRINMLEILDIRF